jgi:hypothetical protein
MAVTLNPSLAIRSPLRMVSGLPQERVEVGVFCAEGDAVLALFGPGVGARCGGAADRRQGQHGHRDQRKRSLARSAPRAGGPEMACSQTVHGAEHTT